MENAKTETEKTEIGNMDVARDPVRNGMLYNPHFQSL